LTIYLISGYFSQVIEIFGFNPYLGRAYELSFQRPHFSYREVGFVHLRLISAFFGKKTVNGENKMNGEKDFSFPKSIPLLLLPKLAHFSIVHF